MKFKYIGAPKYDENLNEIKVGTYGGLQIKSGDSVELNDFYASKALKNPSYEVVKAGKKPAKAVSVGLAVND